MDVFAFVMTMISRVVDIIQLVQEQINNDRIDLPVLPENPPHRDSDLVTILQWLHLQIQHSEECQAAMTQRGRRSEERRDRSLSAARAYLRNAVNGIPESGRWTVVRSASPRGPYPIGVGLGALVCFEGVLRFHILMMDVSKQKTACMHVMSLIIYRNDHCEFYSMCMFILTNNMQNRLLTCLLVYRCGCSWQLLVQFRVSCIMCSNACRTSCTWWWKTWSQRQQSSPNAESRMTHFWKFVREQDETFFWNLQRRIMFQFPIISFEKLVVHRSNYVTSHPCFRIFRSIAFTVTFTAATSATPTRQHVLKFIFFAWCSAVAVLVNVIESLVMTISIFNHVFKRPAGLDGGASASVADGIHGGLHGEGWVLDILGQRWTTFITNAAVCNCPGLRFSNICLVCSSFMYSIVLQYLTMVPVPLHQMACVVACMVKDGAWASCVGWRATFFWFQRFDLMFTVRSRRSWWCRRIFISWQWWLTSTSRRYHGLKLVFVLEVERMSLMSDVTFFWQ